MAKRHLVSLMVLGAMLSFIANAQGGSVGPVYTIAQVYNGLLRHPRAWGGRTMTVRGTLVMITGVGGGIADGVWWSTCPEQVRCLMSAPLDVTVHLVLVPHGPYASAAVGLAPTPNPPFITVRARIRRNNLDRQISDIFEPITPSFIMMPLSRLAVVYDILRTDAPLPGGKPWLYHIRLLPVPKQPCDQLPFCDDAVLIGNP